MALERNKYSGAIPIVMSIFYPAPDVIYPQFVYLVSIIGVLNARISAGFLQVVTLYLR